MAKPTKTKKVGILYVHGAGMPEKQQVAVGTVEGDPLATIANGLMDHFQKDFYLRNSWKITAKTTTDTMKEGATKELELNIYRKDNDAHESTICMTEVIWKPQTREIPISDYKDLMWQWAFAAQSDIYQKNAHKSVSQKRTSRTKQDEEIWQQFFSRVMLAVWGFIASIIWVWGFGELLCHQLLHLGWIIQAFFKWANPTDPLAVKSWDVFVFASAVILATSFVASMLLVVLTWAEKRTISKWVKRKQTDEWDKWSTSIGPWDAKNRSQLLGLALTTAWFVILVLPFLFLLYYIDRVAKLIGAIGIVGLALWIQFFADNIAKDLLHWDQLTIASLNISGFVVRAGGLLLITLFLFWLTRRESVADKLWYRMDAWSPRLRNMQRVLAEWINTLVITGGVPWLIFLINLLGWMSFLPFVGPKLQETATAIGQAGYWNAVKDVYLVATDSSRSAGIRAKVEEAIMYLNGESDTQDKQDKPDSIHIFSHSCGTVVAYDTLCQIGLNNGAQIKPQGEIYKKLKTLVTFGSPLNKIRTLGDYLSETRLSTFDQSRFNPECRLKQNLGAGDFRWINVYTVHDFVSDECFAYYDDPVPPIEFEAWSANDITSAHGIYWFDPGFWNTVLEAMGVVYPLWKKGETVALIENGKAKLTDEEKEEYRREGIVTQTQKDVQDRWSKESSSKSTEESGSTGGKGSPERWNDDPVVVQNPRKYRRTKNQPPDKKGDSK